MKYFFSILIIILSVLCVGQNAGSFYERNVAFGDSGNAIITPSTSSPKHRYVKVSGNRIVSAATVDVNSPIGATKIIVFATDSNGHIDSTYLPAGIDTFNFRRIETNEQSQNQVTNLVADSIGRVYITGYCGKLVPIPGSSYTSMTSEKTEMLIVRLTPNGNLDNSWGDNGIVTVGSRLMHQFWNENSLAAFSILLCKSGKVLVGGSGGWLNLNEIRNPEGYNVMEHPVLVRLNQNGSLDATYGVDGYNELGLTSTSLNYPPHPLMLPYQYGVGVLAMHELPSRKIIIGLAGWEDNDAIWKLGEDGLIDSSFSMMNNLIGLPTLEMHPGFGHFLEPDITFAVHQSDIYMAMGGNSHRFDQNIYGGSYTIKSNRFCKIKKIDTNGFSQTGFGNNGILTLQSHSVYDLNFDFDGNHIWAYGVPNGENRAELYEIKYSLNGVIDTSYGNDGAFFIGRDSLVYHTTAGLLTEHSSIAGVIKHGYKLKIAYDNESWLRGGWPRPTDIGFLEYVLSDSSNTNATCSGSETFDEWAFTSGGIDDEAVIETAVDGCGNLFSVWRSENDYFMSKHSNQGVLEFTKPLPFSPTSITASETGRVALTGKFNGTRDFDLEAGVFELSANSGNEIFVVTYAGDGSLIWVFQLNGNGSDYAGDVVFGPDDRVAITCMSNTSTNIDFNPDSIEIDSFVYTTCGGCGNNPYKRFVVSYNSDGDWEWRHTIGSSSGCGAGNLWPGHNAFDANGNVVYSSVGCSYSSNLGYNSNLGDVYILRKIDTLGDSLWAKHVVSAGWSDRVTELKLDEHDNIYMLAELSVTANFDQNNQLVNDFQVGTPIQVREQHGYRSFLAKFDAFGNHDWSMKIGDLLSYQNPVEHCMGSDLDVRGGNIVVGGHVLRSLDFDPDTSDTAILWNHDTAQYQFSSMDGFIASYSYDGAFKSIAGIQGPNTEANVHVALDQLGNALIAGEFADSVDLDMDPNVKDMIQSNGDYDLFYSKVFIDSFRLVSQDTLIDTMVICGLDSILVNGYYVSSVGVFIDSLIDSNGDAYVSIVHVVDDSYYDFSMEIGIVGDSIYAGGAWQTTTGFYTETLQTQHGCDSIIYKMLTFYAGVWISDTLTICQGETAYVHGIARFAAGVYSDTTVIGSVAQITNTQLYVSVPTSLYNFVSINSGDSIFLGGMWQTTSGTYCDTSGQCDTIICTDLTAESTQNAASCAGSVTTEYWAHLLSGENDDFLYSQKLDGCGNIYVIGRTASQNLDLDFGNGQNLASGSGNNEFKFIAKYNNSGEFLWSKPLPFRYTSMDISDDGRIGFTGNFQGTVDFDFGAGQVMQSAHSGNEIYIAVYDTDGEILWAKQFNGTDTDIAGQIKFGPTNQVGITGQINESDTFDFNPNTSQFNGIQWAYCSQCLSNSPANWKNRLFVVSLNSVGEYQWSYSHGTSDSYCGENGKPGKCDFNDDGGLIYADIGCRDYYNIQSGANYSLRSFNSSGNLLWSKFMPGAGIWTSDFIKDVQTDQFGNTYLLATLYYGIKVDSASNTTIWNDFSAAQTGFQDFTRNVVVKLSTTGDYLWSEKAGYMTTLLYPYEKCIISSLDVSDTKVLLSGYYLREMDFDADPNQTHILTNTDTATIWDPYNNYHLTAEGFISMYTLDGELIDAIALHGESGNSVTAQLDAQNNVIYTSIYYDDLDTDLHPTNENWVGASGADAIFSKMQFAEPYVYSYDSITLCFGDSVLLAGSYQSISGAYVDTLLGSLQDTIRTSLLFVDMNNGSSILTSSGTWLKTDGNAEQYMWYNCDNDSIIATTNEPKLEATISANIAAILVGLNCNDTTDCVYHSGQSSNKTGFFASGYPSHVELDYTITITNAQAPITARLYDLQGQLIQSWNGLDQHQFSLPLGTLPAGYYLLRVSDSKSAQTLKLTKLLR